MKVLYAAYRYDPRNPDLGSGADYQFYTAIKKAGMEIEVVGPFLDSGTVVERIIAKFYNQLTGTRFAKFHYSLVRAASKALNQKEQTWKPDVIFTMSPASLAFYTGQAPCVYRADTTYVGAHKVYSYGYGKLAIKLTAWVQGRAFNNSTKIITHSTWSRDSLIRDHNVPLDRIHVFPNPAALPLSMLSKIEGRKTLDEPLQLLFIGRNAHRKGLDIAIEVTTQLNASGLNAMLTVCGLCGDSQPFVRFVGSFEKRDESQLKKYVELYRQAHLLIHPARFDPSPIVTSEAAAFGVPVITNNIGGIGTSVEDSVSGIVLHERSSPAAYVEAITSLVDQPKKYRSLRKKSRHRYITELNWEVAGKRLERVLREALPTNYG